MSRRITITIDPMANVKVDAEGFSGNDCTKATEAIEKAVVGPGGVTTREFKPSYSASGASTSQRQTSRMG